MCSPKPLPVRCRRTITKTRRRKRPTATMTQRGVLVVARRVGLDVSSAVVRRKKPLLMELPFSAFHHRFEQRPASDRSVDRSFRLRHIASNGFAYLVLSVVGGAQ